MSEEEDDIILSELDDDDLVAQMFDDLYDGLKEEIEEGVNILLERGWTPYDILTEGSGRRHANRRHRFPRRHPVRAGSADGANAMKAAWRSCAAAGGNRRSRASARW
jgi:hypothetical protein